LSLRAYSAGASPATYLRIVWRESLAYVLRDFFETANLTRRPQDEGEFQQILSGILKQSAEFATSSDEIGLSQLHLSKPTDFPLYQVLRNALPALVDHIAPEHGQSPEDIRRKMDRSFSRRFPDAWMEGWSHFSVLEGALGGKVGVAARRAEEWQRYYDWLRWDVEENPIFGQGEGGPALADIFVRLRCYWRQLPPEQRAEADEEERKVTAHVGWLQDEIRDWLRLAHDVAAKARVKALVLGRPTAAENAADEIALPNEALLHLARLSPLDDDTFRRDRDRRLEISDPQNLCGTEQRLVYWNKWAAVASDCPTEPPEALFERELSDLTVEPLLLYLLIFSGYASYDWENAAENRNRVFEGIFRKVHLRDVHEKGHLLRDGLKKKRTSSR
jgi:hypothetical protein